MGTSHHRQDGGHAMSGKSVEGAPPLPTKEGASIVVASDAMILDILLTRVGGCWFDRYGNEWPVETIRAWAPVSIGEVVVMP